ncbi:MAG: hypothetical protein HRU06_12870 [Oceanospirillaceae bacterium]|nr:hypothetical protein [Colwellia sp.]NQZ32159.1 hypothetical protein [Oceanospirillaceae bacterium]
MLSRTNEIKKMLGKSKSHQEKIEILRNSYKGEVCYILTAGPSINDYSANYLQEKLKDELVIAVKQTYDLLPGLVDFHLLNQFNYQKTEYAVSKPIIMKVGLDGAKLKTPGLLPDLEFLIDMTKTSREDSLSGSMDFSNWLLDRGDNYRPFGPGIMHEIGLFLPVLLGAKKIIVIGWDLGSAKTNGISRYYEKDGIGKSIQQVVMDHSPALYNKVLVRFLNIYRQIMFRFDDSIILNNPGITVNEAGFISKSTGPLYDWLKFRGIEFEIVSNNSMIDKSVPRVSL